MNEPEFVKRLTQSPFWDKWLIRKHDILFAYVAGSRLSGLTEAGSDYDIILVERNKADKFSFHNDVRLIYKPDGSEVHWYYHDDKWYTQIINSGYKQVDYGLVVFANTTKDTLLWSNPKYEAETTSILNNAKAVGRRNAIFLYKDDSRYVDSIIKGGVIGYNASKLVHHFLYAAEWLNGKIDKQFLMRVKHCRLTPLSDEDHERTIAELRNFKATYAEWLSLPTDKLLKDVDFNKWIFDHSAYRTED